jgi:hypothetical protein
MRSPADPSWDRTITKFAGFAGSLGFIAFLYWLFPEYSTRSPFYQHFWTLLRVAIPAVLVIALPYIYLVDGRMQNPHDGCGSSGASSPSSGRMSMAARWGSTCSAG